MLNYWMTLLIYDSVKAIKSYIDKSRPREVKKGVGIALTRSDKSSFLILS